MAVTQGASGSCLDETRQQTKRELEPELRPIGEPALAVLELAARKAVAHETAPEEYPMPAGTGRLEPITQARLRSPPVDKRTRAEAQIIPTLTAAAPLPGASTRVRVDLRGRSSEAPTCHRGVPAGDRICAGDASSDDVVAES